MDKNNKYYDTIVELIRNHRKFHGYEDIIDDIIDDVYSHSEIIISSIQDENVIKSYLEKIISTSLVTVPRKLNFRKVEQHTVKQMPNDSLNIPQTEYAPQKEIKVNPEYVDKMINSADYSYSGDKNESIPVQEYRNETEITSKFEEENNSETEDTSIFLNESEAENYDEKEEVVEIPEETLDLVDELEESFVFEPKEDISQIEIEDTISDDNITQLEPENDDENKIEYDLNSGLSEEFSINIGDESEKFTGTVENEIFAENIIPEENDNDDIFETSRDEIIINDEIQEEIPIIDEDNTINTDDGDLLFNDVELPQEELSGDNIDIREDIPYEGNSSFSIEQTENTPEETLDKLEIIENVDENNDFEADVFNDTNSLELSELDEFSSENALEEYSDSKESDILSVDNSEDILLDTEQNEVLDNSILEENISDTEYFVPIEEDNLVSFDEEQESYLDNGELDSLNNEKIGAKNNVDEGDFSPTDFSCLYFEPNNNENSVESGNIASKIYSLNSENPELNILKIYNLKYKNNYSISQIADELSISENNVVETLDRIISIV